MWIQDDGLEELLTNPSDRHENVWLSQVPAHTHTHAHTLVVCFSLARALKRSKRPDLVPSAVFPKQQRAKVGGARLEASQPDLARGMQELRDAKLVRESSVMM
jgi:hypothetical protein